MYSVIVVIVYNFTVLCTDFVWWDLKATEHKTRKYPESLNQGHTAEI